MHLLLTGGGTAGHITPNLAIIEKIKTSQQNLASLKISYIGSPKALDRQLVTSNPEVEFYAISSGKLRRYFSLENFLDFFKFLFGIGQAFKLLLKIKPNLIFSKGGFVALPVVLAGACLRIPIIIHESDSIFGLTSKISAKFATEIWTQFPIAPHKQVILPIRDFMHHGDKSFFQSQKTFNAKANLPNLLIIGGSLGSSAFNDFIFQNLEILSQKFNLIHLTGTQNPEAKASKAPKAPNYISYQFLTTELAHAYTWADLVLSRAGAAVLNELGELHKKAILVPLPTTQSRGEQLTNANLHLSTHPDRTKILTQDNLNLDNFLSVAQLLLSTKPTSPSAPPPLTKFTFDLFQPYL